MVRVVPEKGYPAYMPNDREENRKRSLRALGLAGQQRKYEVIVRSKLKKSFGMNRVKIKKCLPGRWEEASLLELKGHVTKIFPSGKRCRHSEWTASPC